MPETTLKELSTLTDVYDQLVETQRNIEIASKRIETVFAPLDDDGWFSNPIGYTVDLDDPIERARVSFTNFVVNQLNDEYNNLTIDKDEMNEYTKEHGFNADDLIRTIREKYADEDGVTMQQIQTTVKELLPWRSGDRIKTLKGLDRIGETGFKLRTYGWDYDRRIRVETFLKLVDIVLRDIKPSEVDTKEVDIGKVYKDDKVKSLRYFKNNALMVVFHTVDDCEKVKAALFEERER